MTSEPAWRAASPTTFRSARWSRCVPVWLRIVWARRSASTTASTVSPTRSRPWSVPRMDDQPADGLLGVLDREQRRPAARLAELAAIADLAAALGVERRPVEDDLGRALAGQLVELHPVADDRDDPCPRRSSSRSRGTSCRRRGPGSPGRARTARRASRARPSCPIGSARAARRGPPRTRRGRRRRRTRPRARRSGRSGSRTCRGAGTRPRRAASARRAGGLSGRRPTTRGASGPTMSRERVLERAASRRRASGRTGPPRGRPRRGSTSRWLDDVGVRLAHDVDDDAAEVGHERLAPAEDPAVADRPAEDPAEDVAAALVRRQDAVGDQEDDRPGVVRDDLVAEPLRLERRPDRGPSARASGRGSARRGRCRSCSGPAGRRSRSARGSSRCRRS